MENVSHSVTTLMSLVLNSFIKYIIFIFIHHNGGAESNNKNNAIHNSNSTINNKNPITEIYHPYILAITHHAGYHTSIYKH